MLLNTIKGLQYPAILAYLLKWLLIALIVGVAVGGASAFFLISLDWCTTYREAHTQLIWLLPVAGFLIGASYYYWGKSVVRGNNQLLDEYHKPDKMIPFKMAPLVLFGTLGTHLFGGSAGREGTAVQMGGAIADQLSRFISINSLDRKILLIMGISAGFAAVFGTPLAGAIFALEVLLIGRVRFESLVPSILVAIIADQACRYFGGTHTEYLVNNIPNMSLLNITLSCVAGICFGIIARLFSKGTHFWSSQFKKFNYPPLRPVIGGIVIAIVVFLMGTTRYIGLGVPVIVESFTEAIPPYDFLLKLLFTTFTLGAGFKGGEVTPLFFVGGALGNALVWFLPLPMDLLAAMGFVAVFAGATNTPIACTLMGIELFGMETGQYVAVACFVAYLFSGHSGIYSSQIIGSSKHPIFDLEKGKLLSEVVLFRKQPKK
ncbi:voltage-gated chloride channel family protein [Aquimarina agarilytica]|uniref:voltage-gated chloride channel family protein n=1 Tax=Aquimarina agarilytica TaxID=1087449 RepID=UPI0002885D60|nr:voltage-gated chloride channel family protein [Aquimarina agarilytica]